MPLPSQRTRRIQQFSPTGTYNYYLSVQIHIVYVIYNFIIHRHGLERRGIVDLNVLPSHSFWRGSKRCSLHNSTRYSKYIKTCTKDLVEHSTPLPLLWRVEHRVHYITQYSQCNVDYIEEYYNVVILPDLMLNTIAASSSLAHVSRSHIHEKMRCIPMIYVLPGV